MDRTFYQWGKHESNQEVILKPLDETSGHNITSHHLSLVFLPTHIRMISQSMPNYTLKINQHNKPKKTVMEWACKPDSVRDETHFIPW